MLRKASDKLTAHFSKREMRCKCRRLDCDAAPMRPAFMAKLEALRVEWGKPLSPTSAQRCETWNKKVGGAPQSQHLLGNAADFFFFDEREMERFAALAEKLGFGGIGIGKGIVHVDDRDDKARWTY